MAVQGYSTVASRNLIDAELNMLDHAEPIMVLGSFGSQKSQPKRKTDTRVFRRLSPFNATSNGVPNITAANFQGAEGVTPTANTISYTDVTVVLKQWIVLFKFTSKAELMYEDDILKDFEKITGETIAEIAELVAYGVAKAGTSVSYTNGTTRVGLNTAIDLNALRIVTRTIESNRGKKVTTTIKPGPNFDTSAVAPAYVVFIHTDSASDVRDLPHFTPVEKYGTAITPVHAREIGACEEFRFVTSPLFAPYLAAGSATLNSMKSVGDANTDVYPTVVIAEDALAHISLKGKGASSISPTVISSQTKTHGNPAGQFGYCGADFWYNAARLNENWMTRIEHCVSDLA